MFRVDIKSESLSNITDLKYILLIYRDRIIFMFLINSVYNIIVDISKVETTDSDSLPTLSRGTHY